jgi:hypothetical protein
VRHLLFQHLGVLQHRGGVDVDDGVAKIGIDQRAFELLCSVLVASARGLRAAGRDLDDFVGLVIDEGAGPEVSVVPRFELATTARETRDDITHEVLGDALAKRPGRGWLSCVAMTELGALTFRLFLDEIPSGGAA